MAELELGIVNPDMVTMDDGSVEITLVPEQGLEETMGAPFDANLADRVPRRGLGVRLNDPRWDRGGRRGRPLLALTDTLDGDGVPHVTPAQEGDEHQD